MPANEPVEVTTTAERHGTILIASNLPMHISSLVSLVVLLLLFMLLPLVLRCWVKVMLRVSGFHCKKLLHPKACLAAAKLAMAPAKSKSHEKRDKSIAKLKTPEKPINRPL